MQGHTTAGIQGHPAGRSRRFACIVLLALVLGPLDALPALADGTTSPSVAGAPPALPGAVLPPVRMGAPDLPPGVSITAISGRRPARADDLIVVQATGLPAFVAYAARNHRPITLFLNHTPFAASDAVEIDPQNGKLTFRLERSTRTLGFWTELYREMGLYSNRPVPVAVGVGLDFREEIATDAEPLPIAPVDFPMLLLWTLGVVVYAVGALWAGRRTHLLRDRPITGADPSYSLGRTQLAVWFVVVTSCATFIWVVTGSLPGVAGAAPVLLVAGATASVSAGVDTFKNTSASTSLGFWHDLLTDPGGLALHRVQVVIANAIVGAAFLASTFQTLTIETLDSSWIALLGASGLTFCGLKGAQANQA